MESRQQASLPGHDIATTTDAGCSTDAVQFHTSHHVGYSRVSTEVLSRSGIRLIDPQQVLQWSKLLVGDQLLFFLSFVIVITEGSYNYRQHGHGLQEVRKVER